MPNPLDVVLSDAVDYVEDLLDTTEDVARLRTLVHLMRTYREASPYHPDKIGYKSALLAFVRGGDMSDDTTILYEEP